MLYRSAAQPCATPTFKHIYGGKLARALKAGKLSACYRALLAHDLATGAIAIRLSRKQAIVLTHANATYVSAIAGMSESERAALRGGQLSLLARVAPPSERRPGLWYRAKARCPQGDECARPDHPADGRRGGVRIMSIPTRPHVRDDAANEAAERALRGATPVSDDNTGRAAGDSRSHEGRGSQAHRLSESDGRSPHRPPSKSPHHSAKNVEVRRV